MRPLVLIAASRAELMAQHERIAETSWPQLSEDGIRVVENILSDHAGLRASVLNVYGVNPEDPTGELIVRTAMCAAADLAPADFLAFLDRLMGGLARLRFQLQAHPRQLDKLREPDHA